MPLPRKKKNTQPEEELIIYVELEQPLTPDQQNTLAWREDQLIKAGVDTRAASKLAHRFDIDLEQARKLKAQGCTDGLLLKILW